MASEVDRVEPAPRRVRGMVNGQIVFDTVRARYVWEWPNYPQYYIPTEDVAAHVLVDENKEQRLDRGAARLHGLRVQNVHRPAVAQVFGQDALVGLAGFVRFEWDAVDSWFEEDEQIYVHPRNPYVRVDALRSHRHVRVELDGVELADTCSPVLLFETGLPTRYYVDRTDVRLEHLVPTETQTSCPYKGRTSEYWSVQANRDPREPLHEDLVWCYQFPTDAVRAVAGMLGFYNEKVDIFVDSEAMTRPVTHFFG